MSEQSGDAASSQTHSLEDSDSSTNSSQPVISDTDSAADIKKARIAAAVAKAKAKAKKALAQQVSTKEE